MATMTEPKVGKQTLVHCLVEGGVAIIELDDPPANTYTYDMMRQLDEAILRARFDDTVHVLVLRGHGEKFFSAGANIAYLNSITPRYKYFFCLHANETLSRLEHTPKLTIAALNGHSVGGGLEIAMACDIRVAKENAGKIGLPEVNLGVLPGTGGTQRLARIVGKARAIEMMVKGETFSFDKAKELGLVNEVFPADDYWEQVMLYAKQFTPPHKASKAVGLIKRSVQSGAEVPFESGLTLERELQQQLFQSDDAKEGIAAYVEKRVAGGRRGEALRPHEPGHRGAARRDGRGGRSRDRRRGTGGARLPRVEGVARTGPAPTRPAPVPPGRSDGAAVVRARGSGNQEQRQAAVRVEDRRRDGDRDVPLLRGLGRQAHGRHASGERQLLHLHAARAGRRGGRDRAVELPAEPRDLEGGPRARGGLHGGAQAGARNPAHGADAGRAGTRGWAPRRRAERGARSREHRRRGAGAPPARGQDRLHGVHGGGPGDHARGRGHHEARDARARRQEPEHHLRRRRPPRGGARRPERDLLRERGGLRRRIAPARRAGGPRSGRGAARRAGEAAHARRSVRQRDAPRRYRLEAPAGDRPVLHRCRSEGGRPPRGGRRARDGQRQGLLRPGHR